MAEWQLLIYGMTIFVLWKYFEHPFGTSVNIEKLSTKKCKGSSVKMYFSSGWNVQSLWEYKILKWFCYLSEATTHLKHPQSVIVLTEFVLTSIALHVYLG
jgi:hypothetical protein